MEPDDLDEVFEDANDSAANNSTQGQPPAQGQSGQQGDDQIQWDDEGDDKSERDDDLDTILSALTKDKDGDDADEDGFDQTAFGFDEALSISPEANKAERDQLGEMIRETIENFDVRDEEVEEALASGDPRQVKAAMMKVNKQVMESSVRMALQAQQVLGKQIFEAARVKARSDVMQALKQNRTQSQIESAVPAMNTKEGRAVLGPIMQKLKTTGASDKEITKTLNAFAAKLNLSSNADGGKNRKSNARRNRSQADVLDQLFDD